MQVDVFGRCGGKPCDKACYKRNSLEYRFYLAFENTACEDYASEKFFNFNSLVPIVLKREYYPNSPPKSFIALDDFPSIHELSTYLARLMTDDALYAQHLLWSYDLQRKPRSRHQMMCDVCEYVLQRPAKKVYKEIGEYSNANKKLKKIANISATAVNKTRILLWTPRNRWYDPGFLEDVHTKCGSTCEFTMDRGKYNSSDGVMFFPFYMRHYNTTYPKRHSPKQTLIMYEREPPTRVPGSHLPNDYFNATATFMMHSDIPYPYGYLQEITRDITRSQYHADLLRKIKEDKKHGIFKVFSHCQTASRREDVIAELQNDEADPVTKRYHFASGKYQKMWLKAEIATAPEAPALSGSGSEPGARAGAGNFGVGSGSRAQSRSQASQWSEKYLDIDLFGKCVNRSCDNDCYKEKMKSYRFYLAFENSVCLDYITEKFYQFHELVPIVLKKDDYRNLPPKSFIALDDFASFKSFASFIKYLMTDDEAYAEYLMWKYDYEKRHTGTGDQFCTICQYVARNRSPKSYKNIQSFWNSTKTCDRDHTKRLLENNKDMSG
ncbi:unnamed protein product [Bursaphelenchus xylophilus]|uniref:Fucosyltransferase n=1 Tax=Bursaphelenchus xylophilus TaxID=6326 RepID=A0A1I7RQD7_BURXY|nr:unnamed protein product [Bursaphelenchus xylophilus]CAG9104413.1 unnamed protein product [Bursaphelenchus xylophilus]